MMTLDMLLTLHSYRYINKFLVYDFNDGGRYILNRKELIKRFGDRFVRQSVCHFYRYGWIILERIPFEYI